MNLYHPLQITEMDGKDSYKNVSIAIASAVTAYARIYMSHFKLLNNGNNLYYSDTDSIFTDKDLDPKFVGSELGLFKLVNTINSAIFLAPKTYIIEDDKGNTLIKFKGVKVKKLEKPISFTEMERLLIKDEALKLNQEKWYRDLGKGEITVQQTDYNFKLNPEAKSRKRDLIYVNNKFTSTKPLKINYELLNNKKSS